MNFQMSADSTQNIIELKKIVELKDYKFLIPSYQRGYRWGKQEVNDLLDDIWDFSKKANKDEFYCLQPIVVKDLNGSWELIDGQQRLSTIHIILSYINIEIYKDPSRLYSLSYDTRKGSECFLANIDESLKDDNIDYFHIYNAYSFIKNWFDNQNDKRLAATKFYTVLLDQVKIIWYQVNDGSDSIDIFSRLNIGKIPLTNSELIKALFLSSYNFGNNKEHIKLKQLEIAGEWDRIEYALQNDSLWYFLNKDENNLPTRIEFIFELLADEFYKANEALQHISKEYNRYYSFLIFNASFSAEKINVYWKKVKDYFLTFEEWFNDKQLYHLLGFLVTVGERIAQIKYETTGFSKSQLKGFLLGKIKRQINFTVSALEYGKDNSKISKALLLFNIDSYLTNKDLLLRFPFERFKKENWSLEHIHAQNSEGINTQKQKISWLELHLKSLERIDKIKNEALIIEIRSHLTTEISEDIFNTLFSKIITELCSDADEAALHNISNLTLLDAKSNSALNNSVFEVKRQMIIEREKVGSFIPICTRNVFLKYYSPAPSQNYFWSEEDRKEYLNCLEGTLNKYTSY
jgi:uncharacterized protein with ParB-like and HNH nuclease domain